jgi:hypothetical protein
LKETPEITVSSLIDSDINRFDENKAKSIKEYLANVKRHYALLYDKAVTDKDEWINKFQETEAGKKEYQELLDHNQNEKLENLVKNRGSDLDPVIEEDGKLIATADPIFRAGSSAHFIRSHFFAPTKNVFGKQYSTYWVNICVIWGMALLLWITLYFDVLRKTIGFFSSFSIKK